MPPRTGPPRSARPWQKRRRRPRRQHLLIQLTPNRSGPGASSCQRWDDPRDPGLATWPPRRAGGRLRREDLQVGRGLATGPKPEERLEAGHRAAPAVPAEHELVEIDLQMVGPDASVRTEQPGLEVRDRPMSVGHDVLRPGEPEALLGCLLYTSDAADDLTRVDLGGRRIIKKK